MISDGPIPTPINGSGGAVGINTNTPIDTDTPTRTPTQTQTVVCQAYQDPCDLITPEPVGREASDNTKTTYCVNLNSLMCETQKYGPGKDTKYKAVTSDPNKAQAPCEINNSCASEQDITDAIDSINDAISNL